MLGGTYLDMVTAVVLTRSMLCSLAHRAQIASSMPNDVHHGILLTAMLV